MTGSVERDNSRSWTWVSARWVVDNLIIVSLFITVAIVIHAVFAPSTPQFPSF